VREEEEDVTQTIDGRGPRLQDIDLQDIEIVHPIWQCMNAERSPAIVFLSYFGNVTIPDPIPTGTLNWYQLVLKVLQKAADVC